MRLDVRLPIALLALMSAGSGCKAKAAAATLDAGVITPMAPSTTTQPTVIPTVLDLVNNLPRCEVRHLGGELLDLGSGTTEGREAWRLGPNPDVISIEKEGASWARVQARSLSFVFHWDETGPLVFRTRARGLTARSATVSLDGKPIGTLSLSRGLSRVSSTNPTSTAVTAGLHTVSIHFPGSHKPAAEPLAEIDWIHVGPPLEEDRSFAAPTQRDVVQSIALMNVPHRSLTLRAPGSIRCPMGVPAGASLKLSVGMQGPGEGEAEIRILRDGQPTSILQTIKVTGGEKIPWTDLDLSLKGFEGELISIELAAVNATRGSRIVFGDPAVVGPDRAKATTPPARAVILVVISGVEPGRLPPWAPDKPLPTFDALAREGVVFQRHRSPSTVTSSVITSLLTGVSPRQHAVEDPYARIPTSVPTLATFARDASVHSAMFTANPSTFEAFGFARGWDRFSPSSPVSPAFGTTPIEELAGWITEQAKSSTGLSARVLAVAHVRGAHPPFDVTPSEASLLAPPEYTGAIEPRRAGQTLERIRKKKHGLNKLAPPDIKRIESMTDVALTQTDRALSNLIDSLRKANLWNDTLLVVTSDVAVSLDPTGAVIPFAEIPEMTERALRTPLYVHFPGGALAGRRVDLPTTTIDVTRTALAALGIDVPERAGGMDLHALVELGALPIERPFEATLPDRWASRWGELRLSAKENAVPALCDLRADPLCEKDVREQFPRTTLALWRWTYDHESMGRDPGKRVAREPATIDPETAAALGVWGR